MSAWKSFVDNGLAKERSITFTEDELKVVDEVRALCQAKASVELWDSLNHESQINFVRGYWSRKNTAKDIFETIEAMAKWRKEMKVDAIFKERLPLHDIYHKAWPTHLGGEDRYGHWFTLERVEEMDVSLLGQYDFDTIFKYRTQVLEAFVRIKEESSRRLGYRVCQYVYCLDLKGLSIQKHFTSKVRALLQPLFRISGDYYPDSLWSMFLVNTPMSFRMIWRIISPWIDPVVKVKIRILAGSSVYLPAMNKTNIPIESIPEQIGGQCKTISLSDIIDDIIQDPEAQEHNWVRHTTTPDPAVQAAHQKQLEALEESAKQPAKRLSLRKRASLTFSRGLRPRHRPSARVDTQDSISSVEGMQEDGDLIYNGDEVLMKGYLSKQGWLNPSWKRRFFVLTSKGLFYFSTYPTKESHMPRGKIELNMIGHVHAADSSGDASDGIFMIKTPQRLFQIRVDAPEDGKSISELTSAWVSQISTAVEQDLCAIDVEAVASNSDTKHLHKGFLKKRGVFNFSWQTRYVLLTSHAIYYYTDKPTNVGASLKGRLDLLNLEKCKVDAKFPSNFSLEVSGRVHQFRADSKHHAEEWVENINKAVQKEQLQNTTSPVVNDEGNPLAGRADPPMLRSMETNDRMDAAAEFGRSNSTMVEQLTYFAEELYNMAGEMGILVKPNSGQDDDQEPLPDPSQVKTVIRKRVMHMFKLF